jgi:hypothetical protein
MIGFDKRMEAFAGHQVSIFLSANAFVKAIYINIPDNTEKISVTLMPQDFLLKQLNSIQWPQNTQYHTSNRAYICSGSKEVE